MAVQKIDITAFLPMAAEHVVLDVRSKLAFDEFRVANILAAP